MQKSFIKERNENEEFITFEKENMHGRKSEIGLRKESLAEYHSNEEIKYTIRFFPENNTFKDNVHDRRSSIPTEFNEIEFRKSSNRRYSEVVISPRDFFHRDNFDFSDDTNSNKMDDPARSLFDTRSLMEKGRNTKQGNGFGLVRQNYSGEDAENIHCELTGERSVKRYENPLETSENGNEVITYDEDEFFEFDEEIGRPNTHSTPKNSLCHDSLLVMSESHSSSRRSSNEGGSQGDHMDVKTITVRPKSTLLATPKEDFGSEITSLNGGNIDGKLSSSKARRSSADFKSDFPSNDKIRARHSKSMNFEKSPNEECSEDILKTILSHQPPPHFGKWQSGNVNGTGHFERRFSRASVHPTMSSAARDAFGSRLSTVVDEVISNMSQSTDMAKETHQKSYEIECSSGGLTAFENSKMTGPRNSNGVPDNETLLFSDGKRRIDMVLVYEEEDFGVRTEVEMIKKERRKVFRENLEKEGLEFELVDKQASFDEKTYFLKIHAPWQVMTRYAELMNIKMPIKTLKRFMDSQSKFSTKSVNFKDFKKILVQDCHSLESLVKDFMFKNVNWSAV